MSVLVILAIAGLRLLPEVSTQTFERPASVLPAAAKAATNPPAPPQFLSAAAARQSLRESVAAGDLPRFGASLTEARSYADSMPIGAARNTLRRALLIYADLQTVWTFATSSPAGAFYDEESLPGLHDHLSADYPSYASFIDNLRVVDNNGRILYPTAETRSFLLRQLPKEPASVPATARRPSARSGTPAPKTIPAKPRSHPPHQ